MFSFFKRGTKATSPESGDDPKMRAASDPTTPPERLRALAQTHVPHREEHLPLLRRVAAHPNTPPDVLAALVPFCADAFFTNPVAPLLTLEDPGFYERTNPVTLQTLLIRADLPDWFVRSLGVYRRAGVAEAAQLHVAVAGEVADLSAPGWRDEARAAVLSLPLGPANLALELLEFGLTPAWFVDRLAGDRSARVRREALAYAPGTEGLRGLLARASGSPDGVTLGDEPDPDVSPEEIERLSRGGVFLRHLAARHPNADGETLTRLARDGDVFVRVRVARNPGTPPEVLRDLADEMEQPEAVRIALARNPNLTDALLARLAGDASARVRATVARHPNTPPALLTRLSGDGDAAVRVGVARHPRTPPAVVAALGGDASEAVRHALSRRNHLPTPPAAAPPKRKPVCPPEPPWPPFPRPSVRDMDGRGAGKQEARIREAKNPRTPPGRMTELRRAGGLAVLVTLAANPQAPETLLRQLFEDAKTKKGFAAVPIFHALSANRRTPPDLLEALLQEDPYGRIVRLNVATHPRSGEVSERTARALAADSNADVRHAVRRRRAPGIWRTPKAEATALRQAVACSGSLLRLFGLSRDSAGNFTAYVQAPDWRDRLALALNPRLPPAEREKLLRDGNRLVRAVARAVVEGEADPLGLWQGDSRPRGE